MRFLHAVLSSSQDPLSYSIVADYYKAEKRASANALLSASNYFGIAFSSMAILLIKYLGWRGAYLATGSAGIIGGILAILFMREPPKKI